MEGGSVESASAQRTLREIQDAQKDLTSAVHEVNLTLARLDERQQETTRKVDAITVAMSNNYVGAIEFGIMQKEFAGYKIFADQERAKLWVKIDELEKDREGDRTWFIRLTLAGMFAVVMGFIGLKKGAF